MKEKILEIINGIGSRKTIETENMTIYLDCEDAAEEITVHVMEFLEWIKSSECRYWFNPILHKWGLYDNTIEFDEVYQYWINNVKK